MIKNDIVTLTIDGYSSTGDGVAHHDGRAVFVRRALLGEVVEARILKATKSAIFARIERIIERSPERIAPVCPHFGKCGGCATMHMTYDEELRCKHQRVTDALRKIGKLELDLPPVVPSPMTEHYRNKAIFEVGYSGARAISGFYRERSHDVVEVTNCAIQSDATNRAAAAVREWMIECDVPEKLMRYIFCRDGNGVQVVIVTTRRNIPSVEVLIARLRERVPEVVSIMHNVNSDTGNRVLSGKIHTLFGESFLEGTLCGLTFRLSPQSFYQINRAQAEQLYAEAIRLADLRPTETALDLYCGAGTITLALARGAGRVIGAEIVPEAIINARENAARNGVTNAEFVLGDASVVAKQLEADGIHPDLIVVDPPRKGLAPDVIDAMQRMSPSRIVYVSCDPATLARDLKLFGDAGYATSEARAFDMFPRCAHVETVVLLQKKNSQT